MVKRLFEIGQKITPIHNKGWFHVAGRNDIDFPCPKFGEVYTVAKYDPLYPDYISLEEIDSRHFFDQYGFAPVLGDEELEKMLKEEPEFAAV